MNAADREALKAISQQISTLASSVEALTDEETVKALKGLVEIAPTLKELADGYKLAGTAGNFIKWSASVAAGLGALWAFVQFVIFGDAK